MHSSFIRPTAAHPALYNAPLPCKPANQMGASSSKTGYRSDNNGWAVKPDRWSQADAPAIATSDLDNSVLQHDDDHIQVAIVQDCDTEALALLASLRRQTNSPYLETKSRRLLERTQRNRHAVLAAREVYQQWYRAAIVHETEIPLQLRVQVENYADPCTEEGEEEEEEEEGGGGTAASVNKTSADAASEPLVVSAHDPDALERGWGLIGTSVAQPDGAAPDAFAPPAVPVCDTAVSDIRSLAWRVTSSSSSSSSSSSATDADCLHRFGRLLTLVEAVFAQLADGWDSVVVYQPAITIQRRGALLELVMHQWAGERATLGPVSPDMVARVATSIDAGHNSVYATPCSAAGRVSLACPAVDDWYNARRGAEMCLAVIDKATARCREDDKTLELHRRLYILLACLAYSCGICADLQKAGVSCGISFVRADTRRQ